MIIRFSPLKKKVKFFIYHTNDQPKNTTDKGNQCTYNIICFHIKRYKAKNTPLT